MTLSEYVDNIKDRSVAVIGAGVSNLPLIRLLLLSGCRVTVRDRRSIADMGEDALTLIQLGAKLKLGEDYLERLSEDVIFRTPGLMPFDEHLVQAQERGSVVTSEMEAFFAVCPCRIIAVTGSDGKTTTTTIISELLKAAGYIVHLGGNIGRPLLCDAPFMKKTDIAVLELSSFQLHSMHGRPDVAVITNISPNHLDKHKDFQDYIDAKKAIFAEQTENDRLILNLNDAHSDYYASDARARLAYFADGGEVRDGAVCIDDTLYLVRGGERETVMDAADIRLPGRHNLQNYLAAFAAVDGLVSAELCRRVAMEFSGVEHRLETVRVRRGVTYINDSIASSPTRTIAGLHALKTKPIVLLGGYDKHIPFDTLGDELCRHAKHVFLTGATAGKIYDAIVHSALYAESGLAVTVIDDFTETVLAAAEYAQNGDIVLLSPACAAFDKFKNFAERGKTFKKIVMELQE